MKMAIIPGILFIMELLIFRESTLTKSVKIKKACFAAIRMAFVLYLIMFIDKDMNVKGKVVVQLVYAISEFAVFLANNEKEYSNYKVTNKLYKIFFIRTIMLVILSFIALKLFLGKSLLEIEKLLFIILGTFIVNLFTALYQIGKAEAAKKNESTIKATWNILSRSYDSHNINLLFYLTLTFFFTSFLIYDMHKYIVFFVALNLYARRFKIAIIQTIIITLILIIDISELYYIFAIFSFIIGIIISYQIKRDRKYIEFKKD
ncbi:hypothetical protein Curi_c11060 [Gottschalkia acidurici 9a]|uniref:Uncharacterized protein n=1 Tax=Gottschalkia acidurici (strain ATCC 7906 / DSM 604 / BCRC 14475 / CIP 104303 / KCTC 5404 / NCIMB 10678 / 9a) TaxID=1128398 RepID=K0AZI2_GOTA9|nr:hypothetical protein [Gottschalkia acidurici]AFS78120.1 hypothetical protein Curi_c11060 [Gottschalkia acidurici 9a]